MAFKDYTLREKEIQQAIHRDTFGKELSREELNKWKSKIPKRLRGEPVILVDTLRKFNQQCSYSEFLRHYCPIEVGVIQKMIGRGLRSVGASFILKTGLAETPISA